MDNTETKTSNFWDFIRKRLGAEAALSDWRLELGGELDFEKLHHLYLAPTDRMAENIMCPDQCNPSCGFRKVCEWDGKYEAVCQERLRKDYNIEKADAVFFTINPVNLLPAIAKAFKITPHVKEFQNEEDTWTLGEVSVPGKNSARVYLTLKAFSYEVMDLIYRINSKEQRPYILLVTSWTVVRETSEKILKDMGSAFVPLNEVLDFNAKTEFELIRECNLAQLIAPPTLEPESEPENIFRKCGDAWEVRWQGGEKFILTGADTGARYLHFMLERPNDTTLIIDIMHHFSRFADGYQIDNLVNQEGILDGFTLTDLPISGFNEVADETAIRQYRREAKLLMSEIKNARIAGDNVTLEQLEQDLEKVTQAVYGALGPEGQKKKLADQMKRFVDAFRRTVNFAIEKIKVHEPRLASHFKDTIRYGQVPGYIPGNGIVWEL
jgi:hypothetical protein